MYAPQHRYDVGAWLFRSLVCLGPRASELASGGIRRKTAEQLLRMGSMWPQARSCILTILARGLAPAVNRTTLCGCYHRGLTVVQNAKQCSRSLHKRTNGPVQGIATPIDVRGAPAYESPNYSLYHRASCNGAALDVGAMGGPGTLTRLT